MANVASRLFTGLCVSVMKDTPVKGNHESWKSSLLTFIEAKLRLK